MGFILLADMLVLSQVPSLTVRINHSPTLQGLLGVADVMFPPLAEMDTFDDPVYGIIAQIGVDLLNMRVKLIGSHRAILAQQVHNGIGKDTVRGLAAGTNAHY